MPIVANKFTRGKDGRLYNGKGSKGGLAPSKPSSPLAKQTILPGIPEPSDTLLQPSDGALLDKRAIEHLKKQILQTSPPEEILEVVDDIEYDAEHIEFANHNGNSNLEWLTIEQLLEKQLFQNNCDAVSYELYNYLTSVEDYNENFSNISIAELKYERGTHVAVELETGDKKWILDYTAKQFDKDLTSPLIVQKRQWEILIDSYIKEQHNDTRIT